MAIVVELPALGESVHEGTIARWLVKVGDVVEVDQALVEVTTDKVDAEIPAPAAGVVEKILVAEGDTVEVGGQLAMLNPDQNAVVKAPAGSESSEPAEAESDTEPAKTPGAASPRAERADRPTATPLARRAAGDAGVDVETLEGSGAHGRVVRQDVESRAAAPASPVSAGSAPDTTAAERRAARSKLESYFGYRLQEGDRVVPMSPQRKLISAHMVYSKHTSPHVGTVAEVDMTGVARLRKQHKAAFEESHGLPLTFLPFIVHATVRALREFPALNASVVDESIVEKRDIHVGLAVETEKGLVVPVVRNADRLSLSGLAAAIDDLATRARNKKLSPDDLKGGTFTISNPGRKGNLYGFAIINQPQVGIVRMGEMVKRPVVREVDGADAIVVRTMMYLALSYDHRAVDGAPANGFLYRIRELLEAADFDL